DEPRLRRRRPRGRGRWKLRTLPPRRGGGGRGSSDPRAHQPPFPRVSRREPTLRPKRPRGGIAPRSGGEDSARFLRRDRLGHALDARRTRPPRTDPHGERSHGMMGMLLFGIYVFVLAIFVGFEVINKVPSTLHTPLMSGAN